MRLAQSVAACVAASSLAAGSASLSPTLQGQLTPGNFQGRIDGAPEGATLHVPGRYWHPVVINKPLTLIGEDGATFWSDRQTGNDPFLAPITLAGPGHGTVTLVNIDVGGTVDGNIFSYVAGGIVGWGFDALELYQCNVSAPSYWRWHLLCAGGPGISGGAARVLLVGSSVQASQGRSDCCYNAPGVAGIDAPGSIVELSSSGVSGASFLDPCTRDFCPDQLTIEQGAGIGIRADCVYADSASGFGGGPEQYWRYFVGAFDCYTGDYFDCGWGPPSRAFVKTGRCDRVRRR